MDDFGSGHSSDLQDFPFDRIRIGQSFSDGIGTGLRIFDLTRSLDADRSPRREPEGTLRWKTLQIVRVGGIAPAVR